MSVNSAAQFAWHAEERRVVLVFEIVSECSELSDFLASHGAKSFWTPSQLQCP